MERTKRWHLSDPLFAFLTITLLSGSLIDFDIHRDQGLSVPAIREFYAQYLGDLVHYIGNFGFAAAAGILLTTAYKLMSKIDTVPGENTTFDSLVKHSYYGALALIMAGVTAMETASGNTRVTGDVAFSALGLTNGALVSREALHRLRIGRQRMVFANVDSIFEPAPHPTLLHQVANSANELFV